MTPELTVLGLAALLQVLQFAAFSVTANQQVGVQKALGPRDEPITLTGTAGRLQRAMNNHFEALILFTIACVIASLGEGTTALTTACAWTYLIARVLYVPAYVLGLNPWRSIVWFTGFAATTVMLIAGLI
ncbi:MAG: MAPEG family protein [Pseudomonadota bacterium]